MRAQEPNRDPCPSSAVLEAFVAEGETADDVKRHVAGCAQCRERVATIEQDNSLLGHLRSLPISDRDQRATGVPRAPLGYRLVREIGRGGQGIVYEAVEESRGHRVAVKVLGPRRPGSSRAERFEREVRLVQRLDHPNIVPLLASGTTAGGEAYLVLELVEGESLERTSARLRAAGPAGTEKILALFCDLADGVRHAHSHGVIHRDLKPSNVVVDSNGNPRVLDFGLAKELDVLEAGSWSTLTSTGDVLGSLAWMAPEQVRGESRDVDETVDVHGLGLLLYGMLTGRHPYVLEGSAYEILERIAKQRAKPIQSWHDTRHLPRHLGRIVMQCLEKEPADRFGSVDELIADIERYQRGEPVLARPPSGSRRLRRFVGRRPWSSLAAVVVAAVAVGFAFDRSRQTRAAESEQRSRALRALIQGALAGDLVGVEEGLWRHHLARSVGGTRLVAPGNAGLSGPEHSFWSLLGLYANQPSRAVLYERYPGATQLASVEPGLVAVLLRGGMRIAVHERADLVLARELEPQGEIVTLAAAPVAPRLATGGAGFVELFDLAPSTPVSRTFELEGEVRSLAFVDDDLLACAQADGTVQLLNTATGESRRLRAEGEPCTLGVLADGRRLLVTHRSGDELWDLELGELLVSAPTPSRGSVSTARGAQTFARTLSGVILYDATSGIDVTGIFGKLLAGRMNTSVISQDGHLCVSSPGPTGEIVLWRTDELETVGILTGHSDLPGVLTLTGGGHELTSLDAGGTLRSWWLEPAGWPRDLDPERRIPSTILDLDVLPEASLMVAADGVGALTTIDVDAGRILARTEILGGTSELAGVAHRPGHPGELAVGTYAGAVLCGDPPVPIFDLGAEVNSLAFDSSGRLLAVAGTGRIRVHDVDSGEAVLRLEDPESSYKSIHWIPGEDRLVVARRRGGVLSVRPLEGSVQELPPTSADPIRVLAVDPVGKTIVAGHHEGALTVWPGDGGPGRVLAPVGARAPVFALAFSPDGGLLAAGTANGVLNLWLTSDWTHVASWHEALGFSRGIFSCAFTQDGRSLVAGDAAGVLLQWRFEAIEELMLSNLEARTRDVPSAN